MAEVFLKTGCGTSEDAPVSGRLRRLVHKDCGWNNATFRAMDEAAGGPRGYEWRRTHFYGKNLHQVGTVRDVRFGGHDHHASSPKTWREESEGSGSTPLASQSRQMHWMYKSQRHTYQPRRIQLAYDRHSGSIAKQHRLSPVSTHTRNGILRFKLTGARTL